MPYESTSKAHDDRNRLNETPTMIQLPDCSSAGCHASGKNPRNRSMPTCWLRASTVAAPMNTSTTISARATSSAQSKGSCRK